MKEIKLKENRSNRAVFIDDLYDYKQIPINEFDIAILSLESIVYEMAEKNAKNRVYEQNRKEKKLRCPN